MTRPKTTYGHRIKDAAKNRVKEIPRGLNRLLKKSEKQIPHRLKPVRDDKNKGPAMA
jgi:hypothetical protein